MGKARRKQSKKLVGMSFGELTSTIGRLYYAEDVADYVLKLVENVKKGGSDAT